MSLRSGQLAGTRHLHRPGEGADLRARTRAKLADVQSKIADLTLIAATLQAALDAGCDDLETCVATPGCPLVLDRRR